jgi:hypothetical protein
MIKFNHIFHTNKQLGQQKNSLKVLKDDESYDFECDIERIRSGGKVTDL